MTLNFKVTVKNILGRGVTDGGNQVMTGIIISKNKSFSKLKIRVFKHFITIIRLITIKFSV